MIANKNLGKQLLMEKRMSVGYGAREIQKTLMKVLAATLLELDD